MGRYSGWIALYAGHRRRRGRRADSGDSVRPRAVADAHRANANAGARGSASSSSPRARARSAATRVGRRRRRGRPAGAAGRHRRARRAGLEPRRARKRATSVLGHLQRGGSPLAYDRVLATRFGATPSSLRPARANSASWWRCDRRTSSPCPSRRRRPHPHGAARRRRRPRRREVSVCAWATEGPAGRGGSAQVGERAGRIDDHDRVVRLDAALAGQHAQRRAAPRRRRARR